MHENTLQKNRKPIIGVIIPCLDEELTIEAVINECRRHLPPATIFVIDNNSSDSSATIAKSSGAVVISEKRRGKGYVIQSLCNTIEADIYVLVDGDGTYDLSGVQEMICRVESKEADMVVGNRLHSYEEHAFRPFHTFGNKLVGSLINRLFQCRLTDIMSGYRVMNRNFVKNINVISSGFEVETEMTIKALKYGFTIEEHDVRYRSRPPGSHSKLNTFKDGALVLKTIFIIFKDYKPLLFFSSVAAFFLCASLASGSVVIREFIETQYIAHVPLAIFASGSMILSILSFVTGVILDSVNRRFDELHSYLKSNRT